jgi:Bacterial PH domain
VVLGWVAALAALLLTAFAGDAPGRLLGVIATLGLALAALFGTVARPRLLVDGEGVAVRGLLGRRHWPWSRVHRMRVTRHRRLGREIAMLELDAVEPDGSEHLVVLGRLDLNATPEDVLATIHTLRGL